MSVEKKLSEHYLSIITQFVWNFVLIMIRHEIQKSKVKSKKLKKTPWFDNSFDF